MEQSALTFVEHHGIRLCVERRGTGPRAAVFAHGWISSRRMWHDVLDRLDPKAFTAYAFDFRGCGLSDRPPDAAHDLAGYAADIEAVIAAVGRPCTLVGHSMGGKLAQYVASQSHPNIERLILVAPGTARGVRPNGAHRTMTMNAFGSRERIEAFQRAAMARRLEPAVVERLVDDALIAQREHWVGWYDRGRVVDVSECLIKIAVPTLVIAGASDPLAQLPRVKRDVAGAISGALFVALKDAGHNLPVETPEEIAAAIVRFGGAG